MKIDTEQIKQSIDLMDYAKSYTELYRNSHNDLHGPCPICDHNGHNFHVGTGWFHCYSCGKGGDAIKFAMLANGWPFPQACENLTNGNVPTIDGPARLTSRPKPAVTPQSPETQQSMADKAYYFSSVLGSPNGVLGRSYLENRGITLDSAKTFKLGYSKKRNAISIPWLDQDGNVIAIRYRHIDPEPDQPKIVSERGSRFTSLHGYHTHSDCCHQYRTLIVCEGELNAISIYQATAGTNVDVLSLGSESTRIKENEIETLRQWRTCILWTDKRSVWQRIAPSFQFDRYISSHENRDANDEALRGSLSALIAMQRIKALDDNKDALEGLYWDYWNARPWDTLTVQVMQRLADDIGVKYSND